MNHTSFRKLEERNPLQNKKANNKKAISQGKMMVQSLQQAIIWSEILDKPVSRRRRNRVHGN